MATRDQPAAPGRRRVFRAVLASAGAAAGAACVAAAAADCAPAAVGVRRLAVVPSALTRTGPPRQSTSSLWARGLAEAGASSRPDDARAASTLGRLSASAAAAAAVFLGTSRRFLSGRGRRPRADPQLAAAGSAAPGGPRTGFDRFQAARWSTYACMVIGYAVYYFNRLSFSYVGLAMRKDLGLTMVQLGTISSLFPLAYMNSKFLSGLLSDVLGSPVLIFSLGMMMTGLLNIGFALGNTVPWFTFMWVLNGLFQGCGATPCNKMLVNWFPARIRGKWWSSWNASQNIGGFGIPLLAGGLAAAFGWRWGMIAPGIIAIVTGLVCLSIMKDSPEKMGLPSAEEYGLPNQGLTADSSANRPAQAVKEAPKPAMWQVLLQNRFLWCMSVMHFFIYFIRQGVLNWAHFYIMDEFGVSAVEATTRVSGFEFGGLLGCIMSGQVSDWLINRYPDAGAAGLRTRVMIGYSLLATCAVAGLWLLPPVAAIQWLCMASFGFSVYGPQTLITMTGVETVPKSASATAAGILAYPAQLGSMCAGLPFALVVQKFGWKGFFPTLMVLSLVSAAVALPGWNEPSYLQAEARRQAAAKASKNSTGEAAS